MKYERYGGILKEKHGLYDKSKHKKWCPTSPQEEDLACPHAQKCL